MVTQSRLMRFGSSYVVLVMRIGPTLQPVFVSKKLEQDLTAKEIKPTILNRQLVHGRSRFSLPLRGTKATTYQIKAYHV